MSCHRDFDTIHSFSSWKKHHPMLLDYFIVVKGTADLTYFSASVSMNCILFGRLYFTFKYSYFALSTWTIIWMCTQIVISTLITLGYSILMYIVGDEQVADDVGRPMVIVIIINDSILSVSMLSLFIYKLKELIVNINIVQPYGPQHVHKYTVYKHKEQKQIQRKQSVDIDAEEEDHFQHGHSINGDNDSLEHYHKIRDLSVSSQSMENDQYESGSTILSSLLHEQCGELDEHQMELIVVITRHAILSGFAIFFNQMFYVVSVVSMKPELNIRHGLE